MAAVLYVFWVTPEPVREKTASEKELEFLAERKDQPVDGAAAHNDQLRLTGKLDKDRRHL